MKGHILLISALLALLSSSTERSKTMDTPNSSHVTDGTEVAITSSGCTGAELTLFELGVHGSQKVAISCSPMDRSLCKREIALPDDNGDEREVGVT